MNWLTAAFAFVFFCNLLFMVGAFYALMRILDTSEKTGIELQRAASGIVEAGTHVKVMVRRAFNEMERGNDTQAARDSSGGRAVAELSFQVKNLQDQLKDSFALIGRGGRSAPIDDPDDGPTAEDLRAKLHAELNSALAKNHQLQDEIDQTKYRLKDASVANTMLMQEIGDVQGVKQSVVDNLMQRAQELEQQLQKAQERAKAAEKHAEANAHQLDDIRAQISEQKFAASVQHINQTDESSPTTQPDQSALLQQQQDQIDALSAREKALMARISELEGAFQRSLTEKHFIEDRFMKLDAMPVPGAPANAGADAPGDTAPNAPPDTAGGSGGAAGAPVAPAA